MRATTEKYLTSKLAKYVVNTLMLVFLLLWGVESYAAISPTLKEQVIMAEYIINGLFLLELLLRIYVYRGQFFQKMFAVKLPKKKPLRAND